MSGEPMTAALLALLSNRQAHDNATPVVTLKELRALRLLIEAEARQQERDAIRQWAQVRIDATSGVASPDLDALLAFLD